ncbi:hypothetical protein [Marinoscillum pacificum]|uniref:hypothetical protein n=1 Tax=Marinoscillum pacificum TaxID=392723 RepID=UPI002157E67F|nr:hypothetical protein [Marinoscillum pacificum]
MRLYNKRLSRITFFSNLARVTQQELCLSISQGFKDDYNRNVPEEKIIEVFIECEIQVSLSANNVELVRNDDLLNAISILLKS